MKHLIAILPHAHTEAVCAALYKTGLRELTLTDVRQYRPGRHVDEIYKGVKCVMNTLEYVKLEVTLEDAQAEAAIALIFSVAPVDRILDLPIGVATPMADELATYSQSRTKPAAGSLRVA